MSCHRRHRLYICLLLSPIQELGHILHANRSKHTIIVHWIKSFGFKIVKNILYYRPHPKDEGRYCFHGCLSGVPPVLVLSGGGGGGIPVRTRTGTNPPAWPGPGQWVPTTWTAHATDRIGCGRYASWGHAAGLSCCTFRMGFWMYQELTLHWPLMHMSSESGKHRVPSITLGVLSV